MKATHDIFVRAYAVPVKRKSKKSRVIAGHFSDKWPRRALVFDTETKTTPDQSLTFGVYRLCELVDGHYKTTQEGVFYADDLPEKDRKVLIRYASTAISDVPSFPPEFPLYSRTEFVRRILWPAIKRQGALICGLNLPFDLARLALAWGPGDHNEWSLTMSRYSNGDENRNRPRILIRPIDGKKAFISIAKPWKPDEWKDGGKAHFVDLRTLGWALFNRSFSLKTLCAQLKTKHQKLDHEPTGKVTVEEIEYARQDGRCTVDALNGLKEEFDRHPIALRPDHAYSPASIAKSYLEEMGIKRPAEKFKVSRKELGTTMQSYYGGRSETRTRCFEVPVVPVDFTSEYPTCCALLGLFDVLTAKSVSFRDDTENVRRLLTKITLDDCFNPDKWKEFRFFALVRPEDDILPVRTVYDGVSQNIGNNYLTSETPLWFAGCDLIASKLRTGKVPKILRAIRLVPHGKQAGMKSVKLRGSMVEINPYKDDMFRKVIEQRKLNKSDKALQYWLKIFANSIYGFFVELLPQVQKKSVPLRVYSGNKSFSDSSDVVEDPGKWFFPPLASLITSGGRLLLGMTEACVQEKRGTYLFCDTDSLAIVSSKKGGRLNVPGGANVRILPWRDTQEIANRFSSLNPYDPKAVRGSILNLVDANFVGGDSTKRQRQLYGYSIAAKRYSLYEKPSAAEIRIVDPKAHGIGFLYPPKDSAKDWDHEAPQWVHEMWDYIVRNALGLKTKLPEWADVPQMMRLGITTYNVLKMLGNWEIARPYNFLFLPMVDPLFGHAFDRHANEKIMLVCPFSSKQNQWLSLECTNVLDGKRYRMANCSNSKRIAHNIVFPSQFARLLVEYQEHPEAKSLAPDGALCRSDTSGLLQRAHIVAGEIRYIGKETDRKWEEGDDITVLEFAATEYGRSGRVVASEEVKARIQEIGINRCARESGFDRKNYIRKLMRNIPVKRTSYAEFVRWLHTAESEI